MPHLPLFQQIYLYGVIVAFVLFMVVLAYGYIVVNLPGTKQAKAPARQHGHDDRRHAA